MPSLTRSIPRESELHRKILGMLSSRVKFAHTRQSNQHKTWQKAEDNILAYVPESDLDAKRRKKREDEGQPKYTTIKLPYSYALLMSAHTYLTSVFFARSPVHQFSGRHGESEQQVQMLEALISYQNEVGQMLGPYYLWLYDSLKYGIGVLEEFWDNEIIQYSQISEAPDPMNPTAMIKQQVRIQMPGYQGNRVGNVSPYDFLPDPRVSIGNFQKGEFVFIRKRLGWAQIVKRQKQGFYMNLETIKGEGKDFANQGSDSESQLTKPEDEAQIMEADGLNHPARVTVYEGCIEIIPKEWGLGNSDFPEKWMFTFTADLGTIIGAQPHGAMHGKFPYAVLESEVEAYGSYNRGLPEIAEGIQNTMDWLINQHFFNVRAALNNQFILDPSKIVAKDAEDGGAGFVYRLRPEAYGQDIRSFFHQIPVADVTSGHINDIQSMFGMGERVFGVNDQMMGAFSNGTGRKTATEVRTSTGFGVNRLKTMAEYMSATDFSQHAQRLVQNSQQYYTGEKKLRLVGSLAQEAGQNAAMQFLDVSRDKICGFYDFVAVDGSLPIDRLAMANMWKEILVQMRSIPTLMLQYDLGKIFAHVAHLAGIRNVNQFKIQLGSPEQLAQQADAGNIVPMKGSNAPAGIGAAGPGANSIPVAAA